MTERILAGLEPTDSQLNSMLAAFGVKTEEKLLKKLTKHWDIVECAICNRKISLLNCSWNEGFDPIHKNGVCNNGN